MEIEQRLAVILTAVLALVSCVPTRAANPAAVDAPATLAGSVTGGETVYKVPVLTVSGDYMTGQCQHVDFALSRKVGSRSPLTIAVAEDTPSGAGESIRASVWLAAMVTALARSAG